METEVHEELAPVGGAKPSVGNTARSRGQIHESITIGTGSNEPVRTEASGNVEHESITLGKNGRPGLPASAQRMLANIDKHGTVSDDPPANDSPPAAEVPAVAVAPSQATPPGSVSTTPAAAAAPSTAPEKSTEDAIAERTARLETANRDLVTQLEQLKSKPARGEMSAREKALDEAERMVLEDSVGAVRKVFATALGVDDPAHASVDKFMTWLYHDLTERELNVPLDQGIKNAREVERIKALRDRDKRDATAEASKPAPQQADPATTAKVGRVSQLIGAGDHATKYPLLRNLSTDFDGMKPEELLWRELDRGFQTGEYARDGQDIDLIDQASRRIEAHYQALADKIAKARPQTAASTATPTQAAVATDSKADPQASGVRTITNASASVAPATTPAAKPAPTETSTKKPWRNEKERIKMLAAKYFGDAG